MAQSPSHRRDTGMKAHLNRLFKGTVTYGIGGMLQQLVSFLLLPIFTAYLTTADYGIIGILGVVGFLVTPMLQLGIGVSTGIVYFEKEDAGHRCRVTWTALIVLLASAGALAVAAIVFDTQISRLTFQNADYAVHVRIFLAGIACTVVTQPLFLRLQFEERARTYVTMSLSSTLLIVTLNLVLVVGCDLGVMGWIVGTAIGHGVTFLALLAVVTSTTRFGVDRTIAAQLVKLGLPIVPSFAFLFLMGQSGKYMLQWHHGLGIAGVFEIGFRFGGIASLFVGAFNTAWFPFFQSFTNKQEEARELFGRIFTYYTMILGSLCVLAFLLARPAILLMTQPEYFEAYGVIGLVAVANVFIGVTSCFSPGVYYARRVYLITVVQLVSAIIVVTANVLLIPDYGLTGTAVAMLLGYIAMAVLLQIVNRTGKHFIPNYQWRRVFRVALVSVATVALVQVLDHRLSDIQYMVTCPLLAAAYGAVLWYLISSEERSYVRGYFRRFRQAS